MPKDDVKSLQFNEGAEVLDAASAASNAPARSVRTRINTGFEMSPSLPGEVLLKVLIQQHPEENI